MPCLLEREEAEVQFWRLKGEDDLECTVSVFWGAG